MDYSLKEVAGRIKDLREAKGYSQEQLAKLTGVSVEEYRALEQGDTDFSFTFIYKCAKACGVEVVDLLEGRSTTLTSFAITRKGEGLKILKQHGVEYNNLAPKFKEKLAEPFLVKFPYIPEEQDAPMKLNSHNGQEFDVIVKGSLKVQVGNHVDILNEGDSIFYNSLIPHGMIAVSEGGCEFHAVVLNPQDGLVSEEYPEAPIVATKTVEKTATATTVADNFVESFYDENGVFNGIKFKNEDKFNFAFDCVDAIAEKNPDKLAMMWVANDKTDRKFTFSDMKKYSAKTANYFESLGIKKGDTVMLVLKRHYQFWFCMLALHKIGAIAIPATKQLVEHDFTYRYKAANVKAIVCTADGDVSVEAEKAAAEFPEMLKILVGGKRDGWNDFNVEMERFSTHYDRTENTPCGNDPMLMLFTSGTTGYPRIATHSYKYALGHYPTAKHWHNVNPDGLHFTISDTGWGKALWGKLTVSGSAKQVYLPMTLTDSILTISCRCLQNTVLPHSAHRLLCIASLLKRIYPSTTFLLLSMQLLQVRRLTLRYLTSLKRQLDLLLWKASVRPKQHFPSQTLSALHLKSVLWVDRVLFTT